MRARFDVTNLLRPGRKNALAVLVEKNATPGSVKEKTFASPDKNGGPLGADNPTFHASIGWDWIPTVRGRNTGIWNKVYFAETGPVTIEQPFVNTTSIDTSPRRSAHRGDAEQSRRSACHRNPARPLRRPNVRQPVTGGSPNRGTVKATLTNLKTRDSGGRTVMAIPTSTM